MQAPEKEDEGWTGYSIIDLTDLDPQSDPEDFVDLTLETQPAEQEKRPWNEQPGGEADRPWDLTKDDKDTLAPRPSKKAKTGKGGKKNRRGKKKAREADDQLTEDPETYPAPEPRRAARILRPSIHKSKPFTRDIPTLQEAQREAEQRLREKNYSAVEAHGWFGLIDSGCPAKGVRELIAHTPRHNGGFTLDRLRAGQEIYLRSARNEDGAAIRIRFTTPERYYAPGRKITTLSIGVDDAAWLRLTNPR